MQFRSPVKQHLSAIYLFAKGTFHGNNSALLDFFQREFPVPEQFKTVWDGSKLVTEPAEIMA